MFMVVKLYQDPIKFKTVNIYTYYPFLSAAYVAQSNALYTTMIKNPHCKYFLQNLNLRNKYLVNNSSDKFVTKVNEIYLSYQPEQCGFPLLFKIMMDALQYNSNETDKCLVNVSKTLKIT